MTLNLYACVQILLYIFCKMIKWWWWWYLNCISHLMQLYKIVRIPENRCDSLSFICFHRRCRRQRRSFQSSNVYVRRSARSLSSSWILCIQMNENHSKLQRMQYIWKETDLNAIWLVNALNGRMKCIFVSNILESIVVWMILESGKVR